MALIFYEMAATPPPAEWGPLLVGASLILGVSVDRVLRATREVLDEKTNGRT